MARQYAASLVSATFFTIDIMPGVATGTFMTVTGNAATQFTAKPTGQGKIVYNLNPDRSGSVSFVLDQESATHMLLLGLHKADLATKSVVGPFVVYNSSQLKRYTFKNARIQGSPDESLGTDTATVTWTWLFEDVEVVTFNADANVVGA